MAHVFRPSGLPWTSRSIPLEPKLHIKIQPLAIQSQKGYKIRTRSEQRYSCADRPRDEIFKDNYHRRQHQVNKCGYWSDISKPYRPVGDVELDTRALLLKTLDQQDHLAQENNRNAFKKVENRRTQKRRERKSFKFKNMAEKQEPYRRTAELIIKRELTEGRNRMAVVRSGSNFFQVIESEQQRKEDAVKAEKKPTYSSDNWRPSNSAVYSDESSSEDDSVLNWDEMEQVPVKQDYWTHFGIPSPSPKPVSRSSRRTSGKSRRSMALVPVYFTSHSNSVIRAQLHVLRWFLDAMRSDSPTAMSPITTAWSYKTGDSSSTLESKKITQTRWKSFVKSKWPSARPKSAATVVAVITQAGGLLSGKEDKTEDEKVSELGENKRPAQQHKQSVVKRPSTSPAGGNTLSPAVMRQKFCLVAESKAASLTLQLKAMERSRSTACRKKFTSLELTGVLNRDLYEMRASVALDTEDTARRKVQYNVHWFDDLLADLPFPRDEPRYLAALQKLHALSLSQQASKRFTRDRFLAVLLTLREWEISLPEVDNVIRFIRDRVIFMPETEYKEWFYQYYSKS